MQHMEFLEQMERRNRKMRNNVLEHINGDAVSEGVQGERSAPWLRGLGYRA